MDLLLMDEWINRKGGESVFINWQTKKAGAQQRCRLCRLARRLSRGAARPSLWRSMHPSGRAGSPWTRPDWAGSPPRRRDRPPRSLRHRAPAPPAARPEAKGSRHFQGPEHRAAARWGCAAGVPKTATAAATRRRAAATPLPGPLPLAFLLPALFAAAAAETGGCACVLHPAKRIK